MFSAPLEIISIFSGLSWYSRIWGMNNMMLLRESWEKIDSVSIKMLYRSSHNLIFIPEMGSAIH